MQAKDMIEQHDRHGLNTYIQIRGWSVGEAVGHEVISVPPETDVGRIGNPMPAHKTKRAPVISNRHPVGIVSPCDLINLVIAALGRHAAKGSDAARRTTRIRLTADFGIGSDKVDLVVKDSRLQVQGILESNIQQKAIRTLVKGIRGISGYLDRTTLLPSRVVSASITAGGGQ
ncbi:MULTISPECIES: hypothetical protein [unclassified Rhizobium]|uniref:hypothetical protein n=1 Tax=unclassified Rhizobium TaxID=2613769 RepID=UPI003811F76F